MNTKIILGVAPTRRNLFSREDAIKYKNNILSKLKDNNIEFVDIEWLNEDGLLYDTKDVDAVVECFVREKVDALFVPHCNFGTEDAVAKLAVRMGKPVLLWGPRDESPLPDGMRLRDSQCGLFATSKVLSRLGVKFSYIENCRIDDVIFMQGILQFIAAANVVKSFKSMRIGQIGTRPESFWSVIANEAELLEKFGIEVVPTTLIEIAGLVDQKIQEKKNDLADMISEYKSRISCNSNDESLLKMAALKLVMKEWAANENLSAIAIQCWNAMQSSIGIMPCFANSELTGEGLPVVCETDICGAVTAVITQAAMAGRSPIFFADLTVRHPTNNNAELLWHCGSFPYALKKQDSPAGISNHYILDSECPGVVEWEIKGGDITICRFDGIKGEYSLLAAKGKGIDGPKCKGSYVWVEFENWPELERKIIYGPYIHHVAGIHGDIIPVLKEALRYLPGIAGDF